MIAVKWNELFQSGVEIIQSIEFEEVKRGYG